MTTDLNQYLQDKYNNPNMPFGAIFLTNDLTAAANVSQGWKLFVGFVRRNAGLDAEDGTSMVKIENVLAVADWFNLSTLEDVIAFATNCAYIKADKLFQGISSYVDIPYDNLQTVNGQYLIDAVKRNLNVSEQCNFHITDNEYKLLNLSTVEQLLSKCPSGKLKYRAERRDCDDFARVNRGWLSSLGYGNVSIGYVEMLCKASDGTVVGAHALNVAVFNDGIAMLIEPQSNVLMHKDYALGVGATTNEIYLVEF